MLDLEISMSPKLHVYPAFQQALVLLRMWMSSDDSARGVGILCLGFVSPAWGHAIAQGLPGKAAARNLAVAFP